MKMKKNKLLSNKMSSPRNVVGDLPLTWLLSLSRHCGHGHGIQGRYKEKTTLLNRLDPGYPAGRPAGMTTTAKSAEDSRQRHSRMTTLFDCHAFTLIELLVVVLIIGILTAVAVPQYQKAVEKSKAAQAFSMIRSIAAAQEAYYLANGTYTLSFDDLAINIPWEQGGPDWVGTGVRGKSDGNWTVQFYNHAGGQGIAVGRTSGPYAGAGFLYLLEGVFPTKQLLCMERKTTTSLPFSKKSGEYCTKFFPELKFITVDHS